MGIVNEHQYPQLPPCLGPWSSLAACRDSNSDLFFSLDPADVKASKRICGVTAVVVRKSSKAISTTVTELDRVCPVKDDCLAYALENSIDSGVWGGTDEIQRRNLIRAEKKAARTSAFQAAS